MVLDPWVIDCTKHSGLIRDRTDCSRFYECKDGMRRELYCPIGSVFDIDRKVCDLKHRVDNCFRDEGEIFFNIKCYFVL